MVGTGVDEVKKSGAAVELGKKDGGIGLRFRGLNPVKAWPYAAVLTASFSENSASIATHPHDVDAGSQCRTRSNESLINELKFGNGEMERRGIVSLEMGM